MFFILIMDVMLQKLIFTKTMTLNELRIETHRRYALHPDKQDKIEEIYQDALDNTIELSSGSDGDSIKTEIQECDYAMEKLNDLDTY